MQYRWKKLTELPKKDMILCFQSNICYYLVMVPQNATLWKFEIIYIWDRGNFYKKYQKDYWLLVAGANTYYLENPCHSCQDIMNCMHLDKLIESTKTLKPWSTYDNKD